MMRYHDLRGIRRRRHARFLRRVRLHGELYVRSETEFRMAERLHRARIITALVSKWNWIGRPTGRPFREIVLIEGDRIPAWAADMTVLAR